MVNLNRKELVTSSLTWLVSSIGDLKSSQIRNLYRQTGCNLNLLDAYGRSVFYLLLNSFLMLFWVHIKGGICKVDLKPSTSMTLKNNLVYEGQKL